MRRLAHEHRPNVHDSRMPLTTPSCPPRSRSKRNGVPVTRWIGQAIDFLGEPDDEFVAKPGMGMDLPFRPEFRTLDLRRVPTARSYT